MNVCVLSAFRQSPNQQILRWMSQLVALRRELREHYYCALRAVAVEGDSTDATDTRLREQARYQLAPVDIEFSLVRCCHGGPVYGSTEAPERMAALSLVGNAMLDAVRASDDVVVYVESDLVWDGETIRRLIDRLQWGPPLQLSAPSPSAPQEGDEGFDTWVQPWTEPFPMCEVWSPVVMAGETFYDCWAVRRLDGTRIFHPFPFTQPTELGSTGSCMVMPASVARDKRVRMTTGALVEWSERARAAGYRIAVDPALIVRHPC